MEIVCKKEFIIKSGDFILLKINPGDCLEVSTFEKGYFYVTANKISFALDKDYFYTKQELRDQQLVKLLDEIKIK